MEFFQRESEKSMSLTKYSYSDDQSGFESETDSDESKSVIAKAKVNTECSSNTRETQYSPTESFISLHDKYEHAPAQVKKVYVQSQEAQTSLDEVSDDRSASTWYPGVNSPTKTGQTKLPSTAANKPGFSRPVSATVMKSRQNLNEPQSQSFINTDSDDSEVDFDSVRRQEKYSNRKSSAKTRERDAFLRNKKRELDERILLSSPDRSFPMLEEQLLMGQKNVAFENENKDSDLDSFVGTSRSQDPKDSGYSDAKSSAVENIIKSSIRQINPRRKSDDLQKLEETPRTPRVQLPPPRREELLDSDHSPESRSSSILKRIPLRRERIGINWQKNTIQQVTNGAPANVKKYQLERRIFQELLELKRLQIRASKANEAVIVKQLSERYNNTVKTLAPGDQYRGSFFFKEFEAFLYTTLQKIQSPEKSNIASNYSLPLTDSGSSTPLSQYHSTQTRYVPRSRKFTELERLTNILKKHNVDCSNMTKGCKTYISMTSY